MVHLSFHLRPWCSPLVDGPQIFPFLVVFRLCSSLPLSLPAIIGCCRLHSSHTFRSRTPPDDTEANDLELRHAHGSLFRAAEFVTTRPATLYDHAPIIHISTLFSRTTHSSSQPRPNPTSESASPYSQTACPSPCSAGLPLCFVVVW